MIARSSMDLATQLPVAFQVFEQGRQRNLHLGLQLCITLHGERIADGAWGTIDGETPLTADHWLPWLSAGKPLTAALIATLWERGRLQWDDPVSQFLPEFDCRNKREITIRHLLTHTAGLRLVDTGWPDCDWGETISRICAAPLDPEAIPGQSAGYHVASSWFLLGEIVQRITQQSFADSLESELLRPCGMRRTRVAISADEQAGLGPLLAPLWQREQGELQLLDWHLPPRSERPSPGSSLRGPISDLCLFYETLQRLGAGPQGRVLRPETVRLLTSRQRIGSFDLTLGHIVDFGLGVIIDSNHYGAETVPYGYGRHCSPDTFGHGGAQSSQGYCDPQRGLVVAYVFNGRPGEPQHSRRCRQLNEALYQDLGLAQP